MSGWTTLRPSRHQVAIAGIVSNAQTQQVIPNAEVRLSKGSSRFSQWLNLKALQYEGALNRRESVALTPHLSLIRDKTGLYLATQTTLEGHFYFIDLPSGRYDLSVSLPGAGTRYGTRLIEEVLVKSANMTENDDNIGHAIANITLPSTGIKGRIVSADDNQPIMMAKIQVEGNSLVTFSDRNGNYLITGLEVWQQSERASDAPRPLITVSAQGYQNARAGIWLRLGEAQSLDISLTRK